MTSKEELEERVKRLESQLVTLKEESKSCPHCGTLFPRHQIDFAGDDYFLITGERGGTYTPPRGCSYCNPEANKENPRTPWI